VLAKHNPFQVQRTDSIPFDFCETGFDNIDAFAKHVQRSNFRGAIVGRHGRGKTTLLEALHWQLRKQNVDCELIVLPQDKHLQTTVVSRLYERGQSGAIVLVDGIERLGFFKRHRLLRHSKTFGGLVATTHHFGRLPTLVRCSTSQRSLVSVLETLGLDRPEILASASALLPLHKGNIRSVLRELYDQYADGEIS
jgi:hypothetical protein